MTQCKCYCTALCSGSYTHTQSAGTLSDDVGVSGLAHTNYDTVQVLLHALHWVSEG